MSKPSRQGKMRLTTIDWREALARLEGAYADSTLRAYRADFEVFDSWCRKVAATGHSRGAADRRGLYSA